MEHSIYNPRLGTTITIDETLCQNTCISVEQNENGEVKYMSHYLSLKELDDLIQILRFIRNKKI